MSGGHFNYDQYKITQMIEEIKQLVLNNDNTEMDRWGDPVGRNYPPEVIEKFVEAAHILKTAFIYANRIDYLVSCDDSEESFLRNLETELRKIGEE